MGVTGLNFEMLGYYLYYYNYAEKHYNRFVDEETLTQILNQTTNDFEKTAVCYGNQYA